MTSIIVTEENAIVIQMPAAQGLQGIQGATGATGATGDPAPLPTSRTVSGTTDTILSTDNGNYIFYTSASAVTVTLPNNLVVDFNCCLLQKGAGQVTLSPASGATLTNRLTHTKLAGQNAAAGIMITTNSGGSAAAYTLFGDTTL